MTRPEIFGVVNVTPDSFSDGGEHFEADAAIAHGLALVADGADWIDVGGESTRPGAQPVGPEEERRRILPVIRALAAEGIAVSVDTMHPDTALAALDAGARLVNDVSGADPDMPAVVAETGARYVVMHNRGEAGAPSDYADVAGDVRDELLRRVDALVARGVDPAQLILDPGIGFSKDAAQNWALLRGLDRLTTLDHPVLLGTSRKRFIRTLAGESLLDRDIATAATSLLAAQHGVWAVRVHDVRATRLVLDTLEAWSGE